MKRIGLAVGAGIAASSFAIGLTAVAAWLIATAAHHPAVSTLAVAVVAVRTFGIGRGVLRYGERLAGHDAVLRQLASVRATVVRHLAELVPAGAPELRTGDLTTRLVADVDSTADRTLRVRLPAMVAAAVGVLATIGAAVVFPPVAAALVISFAMVALVAPTIAAGVARRDADRQRQQIAPLRGAYAAAVTQTLHGAGDLIAYDADDAALGRLDAADREVSRAGRRSAWAQGLAIGVGLAAAGLVPLSALWWGVPAVHQGRLTLPLLAVVTLAPLALYEVLAPLIPAATLVPQFRAAQHRLDDITTRTPAVAEPQRPVPLPGPPYRLVIEDLAVAWPSRPDRPVFTGLNLTAAAGQRIAVIGPSGSGKSTLAAALMRFVEPAAGTIRINGTDIREVSGDDARRLIGLCAQDAYLFDSTIAENVRLARPGATDEDVLDALRQARLGDWVATLPDGLHTWIGEHGARLSGGQRQRLSLARVLLANCPIVVLDEPTEHLDEAEAARVLADLFDATRDSVLIAITHRSRDLRLVDAVVDISEVTAAPGEPGFIDARVGN